MRSNAINENAELKVMTMADKNKSTVERLSELKQLYDAGLLTETEMEAVKAEILGKVDIQQNEGERQNIKQPIDNEDDSKPSLRKRILRYAIRGIIALFVFFFILVVYAMCHASNDNKSKEDYTYVSSHDSLSSDNSLLEEDMAAYASEGTKDTSVKTTKLGYYAGNDWMLVEKINKEDYSKNEVYLEGGGRTFSLTGLEWEDDAHDLSSVMAAKLHNGKIWIIAPDNCFSAGEGAIYCGTQIFYYDIDEQSFHHVQNCYDAMFKGKTIKVYEAYLVKDNGCTADNQYGKKMTTIKLP
jgi:hypothetical protein